MATLKIFVQPNRNDPKVIRNNKRNCSCEERNKIHKNEG